MKKKLTAVLAFLLVCLLLCSCGKTVGDTSEATGNTDTHTSESGETAQSGSSESSGDVMSSEAGEETEAAEPAEPEIVYTVLRVAMEESVAELTDSPLTQCLYLPLLTVLNGEYHSDVLSFYTRTGGTGWHVGVKEGLVDSDGHPFEAVDLAVLLDENPGVENVNVESDNTVTFTLSGEAGSAIETLLMNTYAVTSDAAGANTDVPAGFGPYKVESVSGSTVILCRNEGCTDDDEPCRRACYDRLVVSCGISAEDQYTMLENGTIDVACNLNALPEGCIGSMQYTGRTTYLVVNPNKNLRSSVYGRLDFTALTDDTTLENVTGMFRNGFPGISEEDNVITGAEADLPASITIVSAPGARTEADAVAAQLKARGYAVSIVENETPASVYDWDFAVVESTAPNAYEVIAELFAPSSEGASSSKVGYSDASAMKVAELMGTIYGENETNLELFLSYNAANPLLHGLTADVTYSAAAKGFAGAIFTSQGILPGTVPVK